MTLWKNYLDQNRERFVSDLLEFVRIPSVSASADYVKDVEQAAAWVCTRLDQAGAENMAVLPTGGHPVVYADWLNAGPDKPTVLLYGHLDVQPAEPLELWESPPFEPEIRDGCVYGRGASDDKGGMLAPILAFEAHKAATDTVPVNVKFLFEGQEEIGSPQLPAFVAEHREMLACDMIFSADGLQWAEDEPNIIVGLKGLMGLEITVTGASADQHSGLHGGAIANPIQALSHIIASLKGLDGRIQVAGFYDDVVPLSEEERAQIARVPFDETVYTKELGVPGLFGEQGYSTWERLWARPTLELNGISGGYQGKGSKTVLPSTASGKITCRLVANQKPEKIYDLICEHIAQNTPTGVRVSIEQLEGRADPYLMPKEHDANQVAHEVLSEVYGVEPYVTRLGGSIPLMSVFLSELGIYATTLGFSLGDENLHAPNEFIRLKNFERGQQVYGLLLERLGEMSVKGH